MSHIRASSNPEGLYVYDDVDRNTYIYSREADCIKMPSSVFRRAVKKGPKNFREEKASFRGFSIEEMWIPTLGHVRIVNEPRIRLSYKDKHVLLWPVTWDYVVNSVLAKD